MGGNFIISLDFEKYWGMIDEVTVEEYRTNLMNEDLAVEGMLELFQSYGIHATWAVVGFLFFNNETELLEHIPENTDFYANRSINSYQYLFNNQVIAEFHFALPQLQKIMATPHQEIASHTFSHYYCLEPGQKPEDFEYDLMKFKEIASGHDLEINTLIFPKNQINRDYFDIMKRYGIQVYRGNEEHFIYKEHADQGKLHINRILRLLDRYVNLTGHHTFPLDKVEKEAEIYNVRSSRFLAPYSAKMQRFETLRLKRIRNAMTHAAVNQETYHLWWHPHNFGKNLEENLQFLKEILEHFRHLEQVHGYRSLNMRDIAAEREQEQKSKSDSMMERQSRAGARI